MTYDELIGSADKNGNIPCDVWKEWDESYSVFDVIVRYKDGRSELYSSIKGLVTAKINLTIKYYDKNQNTRIKLEDILGIDIRNYRLFYPNRDDLHDKEQMLFDWDKVARIVKYADKYFKNDPKFWIEATVYGGGECTSGVIYKNGKPNYSAGFSYLASAEFKPMIVLHIDNSSWRSNREALIKLQMVFDLAMDFDDPDPINTSFTAPCYKMQHEVPDWNASTWWPESAKEQFLTLNYIFMEDKIMFEKTKEKVNNYFEEHPKVKKVIVTTVKVSAVAGAIFIGYKIGKSQNDISKLDFQPLPEVPENPVSPELVDTFKEKIMNPLAPDDHTFDVIFQDTETGTKYISKDYCLGSYVNDCLDGMDMSYEVLEDLKEGAEKVVDTVVAE